MKGVCDMKDKNELTDMLRDADDDTISRIAEEYPQHTKEEADRIYREVEKRIALKKSGEAPDSGSTVSGVDRVKRPVWLRPLAMAASFVLIAGTVAGSIALMKNSKTLKDSESTVVAATQSVPLSTEVYSETETAESNTDAPNELTEEWLLDRVMNSEKYYDKCYMECSENGELRIKAVDHINNICYREMVNSKIKDYCYNNRRLTLWSDQTVVENPAHLKFSNLNASYKDISDLSIEGTEEYIGRKCAVVSYLPFDTPPEDKNTKNKLYIDLETGIIIRAAFFNEDGSVEYPLETSKFYLNDEATMIPTPQEIKQLVLDNAYTLEDGLSLDFLDEPLKDAPNAEFTKEELISQWNERANALSCFYHEYDTKAGHYIKAYDRSKDIYYYRHTAEKSGTTFNPKDMTLNVKLSETALNAIEYRYKGKNLSLTIDQNETASLSEDNESPLTLYKPDFSSYESGDFSLKGTEEFLGRKCAVFTYAPPPTKAQGEDYHKSEQWIDIETGMVLRAGRINDDGTADFTMETKTFLDGDKAASSVMTPQEFKQEIEKAGISTEGRSDLDFLDE